MSGIRVYRVSRIVIARFVTLRDLSKLAYNLGGYVLRKPIHASRMLFNLPITQGRYKVRITCRNVPAATRVVSLKICRVKPVRNSFQARRSGEDDV